MNWSAQDQVFMARAIKLAKKGQYTARPNPMVGCVLVKNNEIIGEGWHEVFGQNHAEINALIQAGSQTDSRVSNKAKGATCYVTVEPCCHQGKTPPCAQALIDAGIVKVISAMRDPNPKVDGGGFTLLNKAGIKTYSGLLEKESRELNRGFISRFKLGKPWVTLKLAMSLDGKTALADGTSKWITGSSARKDVQKLRAKQDAILTGIGTFLADDPSLNVRPENAEWWNQLSDDQTDFIQPRKILLDRKGRAKLNSKFFNEMGICSESNVKGIKEIWWVKEKQLVKVINAKIESDQSAIEINDLSAIIEYAAKNKINNLLVEAGHQLAGAFISENLVDEIVVYIAPKLMGKNAMSLVNLNVNKMDECPVFKLKGVKQFGEDVRLSYLVESR
ncbi:MAG: diaminohydroxyphosphoribosylaminopyrimidine deaminase [Polaribacter sp.]|jgi:diaminohydroxyphosphoribosylaminopyrimidine deaminase/5-amino-6-(5-phosphoribosylamino)uracil reductase